MDKIAPLKHLEDLKRVRDTHSDEIPDKHIHSDSRKSPLDQAPRYKCRKSWFFARTDTPRPQF